MNAEVFWQLIADICELGEFIATTRTGGASTYIVGSFQVGYDGCEAVIVRTS